MESTLLLYQSSTFQGPASLCCAGHGKELSYLLLRIVSRSLSLFLSLLYVEDASLHHNVHTVCLGESERSIQVVRSAVLLLRDILQRGQGLQQLLLATASSSFPS